MTLHSAPGRRSRQPHRHHRSAGPVLDPNRRCLAARSRRPARPKAGARWEQRSDPHRGNRYHICDRLEGPLSHRRTGLHIFRSRYRPDHHHPRLPHRQARPDGLTEKFQIFLARHWRVAKVLSSRRCIAWEEQVMTIATTSSTARQSVLKHVPKLALALAGIAVVLLALGPIGWRLGWWHFRFSLLTLMPWAAYVGLAAVIVSALALVIGLSRLAGRGIALALVALIGGGLIAYVPWHYDQLRQTLPPIHDITTDPDNPPTFVAVVPLRQGEGINSVAYEGAKIADQQRRAYPEILPLTVGLQPDAAFARALETAQRMGWTIVASDKSAGRIEASQRSRWMGFTDDIVVRVALANSGSRIDLRSSSRYGRSDFGVNAERIRDYLTALRAATTSKG